MKNLINDSLKNQSENLLSLANSDYSSFVSSATDTMIHCLKNGGKILVAGNGGSAADAQHFAAELVGRFLKERKALPSIALTTDSSILTSVANDYSYDVVFSRQIEALGNEGDIFLGISTSGNSNNVIEAIHQCKKQGMKTVCLLGKDGGSIKDICDFPIVIPFNFTPRIQEIHTFTIHLMCQIIEDTLFI